MGRWVFSEKLIGGAGWGGAAVGLACFSRQSRDLDVVAWSFTTPSSSVTAGESIGRAGVVADGRLWWLRRRRRRHGRCGWERGAEEAAKIRGVAVVRVGSDGGRRVATVKDAGSIHQIAPVLNPGGKVRSTVLMTQLGLGHERDGDAAVGHVAQP